MRRCLHWVDWVDHECHDCERCYAVQRMHEEEE